MMSEMTIGRKLYLSLGSALVLTLMVSVVSLQSIGSLGALVERGMNKLGKKQYLACSIDNAESDAVAAERGLVLRALTKEATLMDKGNSDFGEAVERMKKLTSEVALLVETDEGRRVVADLQKGIDRMLQNHQQLYALASSGKTDEAAAFLGRAVASDADTVSAEAKELVQLQNRLMADAQSSAQASVTLSRWVTLVAMGLFLLVAGTVVFVVRQTNRSLRQAVTAMSEGSGQVSSAASQVASSSQSLAQGSSEQAASLEETSASTEQINSMAQKNTENSRAAADLVTQSQQKFSEAHQALEQTVAAMGEINTQSGKISKIIKVIDEIAFQTNILALNAAVEAARAGEAGMGFAVVADEVRNLAQRCAQAAKDTASLIEESIAKSNDGKTKVDQVAAAIRAITEVSGEVKTLVDEVNLGSQEQARGIEQIAKAITQMEQVTQKTAANAEESASAAEELNAQSETLKEVIERLTAMVGGGEAASGGGPHAHRRTTTDSGNSRPRKGESAAGLASLRKAVARQPKSVERPAPVLAAQDANPDPFPLDEQFKEF